MTKLPSKVIVNRIPYTVKESDDKYSYEADPRIQEIRVTSGAAAPRQRQYFMWEIAHLLLTSAGMSLTSADRYHSQVGSVLNRLVIDNSWDWLKTGQQPTSVWINGLPYSIKYGTWDDMEKEDLGGNITYDPLEIRIADTLADGIRDYVIIHEITHGLLFEACVGGYASREPFVEALAWQLLYFMQDNDLSKLRPEKE